MRPPTMHHVGEPLEHPVSRRLTLLAGTALPLTFATACTVRSPLEARPTTDPAPAPTDPDLALRDAAQAALVAQLDLIASTMAARPRLEARLTPLKTMHVAHFTALPGGPGQRSSTPPAATWDSILDSERALQRRLAGLAQRAESGGFARLLASMSAAIGQALARTDGGVP